MNIKLIRIRRIPYRLFKAVTAPGALTIGALYYFIPSFRYFVHDIFGSVASVVRGVVGQ